MDIYEGNKCSSRKLIQIPQGNQLGFRENPLRTSAVIAQGGQCELLEDLYGESFKKSVAIP